jgi:hypothetical protein
MHTEILTGSCAEIRIQRGLIARFHSVFQDFTFNLGIYEEKTMM